MFKFGGATFAWGWNEGGVAGTATSFLLTSDTGYGTLISDPTMTTLTDKTVIVLNTEESMYTLAANLLVSDGNHLTVTPATYNNATVSEATGTLTIERTNSNGTNNAW